jgi:hypothetical protein
MRSERGGCRVRVPLEQGRSAESGPVHPIMVWYLRKPRGRAIDPQIGLSGGHGPPYERKPITETPSSR